jgi:uncharacterized protein YecT (DUF1311 family)
MRFLAIIFIIFFGLISCNQNSDQDRKNFKEDNTILTKDIDTICETLVFDCYEGTQLEINLCSKKEFEFYDSILINKYNELIEIIDKRIENEKQFPDKFEYKLTSNYKNAIVSTHNFWIEFRDKNAELKGMYYEGGTIQPYIMNKQLIIDTKNRIEYIEELINNEL